MTDLWLPGAVQIANPNRGGSWTGGPWRLVWHTTEVIPTNLDGARTLAGRHPNPPHLWAWPGQGWLAQTVPFDQAAKALEHPAGTPDTNREHAIQVEVIGFAEQAPTWPGDWWQWLGEHVVAPLIRSGYPINLDHLGPVAGDVRDAVRQSRGWWAGFDGMCGHANVPDQTQHHWDPGIANYPAIADAARAALNPPAPPPAPVKEYLDVNVRVHQIVMTLGNDGKGWNVTPDPVVGRFTVREEGRYSAENAPNEYDADVLSWRSFIQDGHVEVVVAAGRANTTVAFEILEYVPA